MRPRLRWIPPALLIALLTALAVFTRGFTAFPSTYYMTGPSMAPTLDAGDWFLTRPLVGGLPARGELVIMRYEEGDSVWHVLRRAVGLPGDTVAMRDGLLWVNRLAPGWPARVIRFRAERTLDGPIPGTIYNWGPVVVGRDSVFVLSDTRDMIGWPDSRWLGAIPRDRIVDRYVLKLRRASNESVQRGREIDAPVRRSC
ncbi:MAG: signal peptidase I [Gemmatimonadales bacterium]